MSIINASVWCACGLTLLLISVDTDGLISQALLLGNFEGAVELCMRAERFADAIILAIAGGENLLKETQKRYFAMCKTKLSLVSDSFVYLLSRGRCAISWQMFVWIYVEMLWQEVECQQNLCISSWLDIYSNLLVVLWQLQIAHLECLCSLFLFFFNLMVSALAPHACNPWSTPPLYSLARKVLAY